MRDTKTIFGKRLRVLRKQRGWTIEELGHKAEMGYKHVADMERGVKAASFDAVDRLANALSIEPFELFLPTADSVGDPNINLRKIVEELDKHGSPAMKRFLSDVLSAARDFEARMPSANH
jgi:transcriptional regulator with XRE-family HTH domain